jgi:putative membrane protein
LKRKLSVLGLAQPRVFVFVQDWRRAGGDGYDTLSLARTIKPVGQFLYFKIVSVSRLLQSFTMFFERFALNSALVAYLHYLSFAVVLASLTIEALTFTPKPTVRQCWQILAADTAYGIAGIGLLVTGILRLLYFAKGAEFYTQNPVFWVKMGLFITVGLLSLLPTISYLRWIGDLRDDKLPLIHAWQANWIPKIIYAELIGFSLIPFVATLMARGIGLPA